MEKFFLKTKKGEVLNYTTQENKDLAIQYFCKIKNLSEKDLLKIFKIEK